MTYQPLNNYIESLSAEEKLRFTDLIAECLDRDMLIEEASAKSRENLKKLAKAEEKVLNTIHLLDRNVGELSKNVFDLYLRVVPVQDLFKNSEHD